MQINKYEFNWARPLNPLVLSKVTAISIHHMAHLTAGLDEIHKWHLENGWKGFAYNYWIDYEGTVWEGRGLHSGAALYDPLNDEVISIGFKGDFDILEKMPNQQFNSGVELIKYLKSIIPTINLVAGHNYWQQNTSCPGKFFPLDEMIEQGNILIKDMDDVSQWAKDAVKNVIKSGIMIGDDKGYFNPKDYCTRQELAVIVSRLMNLYIK